LLGLCVCFSSRASTPQEENVANIRAHCAFKFIKIWWSNPNIFFLEISFFTKFTFSKSHFCQKSHVQNFIFQNLLFFYKIHIFKISFLSKFTFWTPHFCNLLENFEFPIETVISDFWTVWEVVLHTGNTSFKTTRLLSW